MKNLLFLIIAIIAIAFATLAAIAFLAWSAKKTLLKGQMAWSAKDLPIVRKKVNPLNKKEAKDNELKLLSEIANKSNEFLKSEFDQGLE